MIHICTQVSINGLGGLGREDIKLSFFLFFNKKLCSAINILELCKKIMLVLIPVNSHEKKTAIVCLLTDQPDKLSSLYAGCVNRT